MASDGSDRRLKIETRLILLSFSDKVAVDFQRS